MFALTSRGGPAKIRPMKSCLREPIPELEEAARLLDAAASALLLGKSRLASDLVEVSDFGAIRDWTESLWGKNSPYVQPSRLPSAERLEPAGPRMPSMAVKRQIHLRDGYRCRFCGIPVIRAEVRQHFQRLLPTRAIWGSSNQEQHAAFQAMWAQYDHVVPYRRGGQSTLENMVLTCAPCNFGRMDYLCEEVGLVDPRDRDPVRSDWSGIERMLKMKAPVDVEVLVRLGAEGGKYTIERVHDGTSRPYEVQVVDQSSIGLGEEPCERTLGRFGSISEALGAANPRWYRLHPIFIAADCLPAVLEALTRRGVEDDEVLERWREVSKTVTC